MTVTFGTVTLTRPRVIKMRYPGAFTKTTLLSGNIHTDELPSKGLEISFECVYTDDYSDITDLKALMGQRLTLTLGSTPFTNMVIAGDIEVAPSKNFTRWTYYPNFVQRTV